MQLFQLKSRGQIWYMGEKLSTGKNTPNTEPAVLDRKSQNSLRKSDIG